MRGIDDDGAGRFVARVADDLPLQARIDLCVVALFGRRGLDSLRCDLGLSGWREKGEQRLGFGGTARQRNGADQARQE